MKKMRSLALCLLGVAAIGALAFVTLVETPTVSAEPPPCFGSYTTPEFWGSGSSCWSASQDVIQQALAVAEQRCGPGNVCIRSWNWSPYCHGPYSGVYKSDASLNYGCKEF